MLSQNVQSSATAMTHQLSRNYQVCINNIVVSDHIAIKAVCIHVWKRVRVREPQDDVVARWRCFRSFSIRVISVLVISVDAASES